MPVFVLIGKQGRRAISCDDGRTWRNDVAFDDPTGTDHDAFAPGLKKAIYNFMHGIGLDEDVRRWFDFPVPKARVPKRFIEQALSAAVRPPARGR